MCEPVTRSTNIDPPTRRTRSPVGAHGRRSEPTRLWYEIEQSVVTLSGLREQVCGEEPERVALVGPVVGKWREVQP